MMPEQEKCVAGSNRCMCPPRPRPSPVSRPKISAAIRSQVDAVRDREVVRPVGRGDRVVGGEVGADAGRDRLLAGRQVHLAGHQTLADVEPRPLVGVVLAQDRLLEGPDEDHRPVQTQAACRCRVPPARAGGRFSVDVVMLNLLASRVDDPTLYPLVETPQEREVQMVIQRGPLHRVGVGDEQRRPAALRRFARRCAAPAATGTETATAATMRRRRNRGSDARSAQRVLLAVRPRSHRRPPTRAAAPADR